MRTTMQRRTAIFLVLAGAFAVQANADEVWSGWTRITFLYPQSTGMNFNTAYANTSLSSCDSGTRWDISSAYPNYNTLVATLIAAFASGKEINMNITVNPPACAGVVNRFLVR